MEKISKSLRFKFIRHVIATPFIWAMIIPVAFADLLIEIYHRVCFPLYGIPYVRRSEYIRIIDRYKLPYLNLGEKLGCAYCGYVNGWLHYASIIAARTEQYWCGIAHLEERGYRAPAHETNFTPYGDEVAFRRRYLLKND